MAFPLSTPQVVAGEPLPYCANPHLIGSDEPRRNDTEVEVSEAPERCRECLGPPRDLVMSPHCTANASPGWYTTLGLRESHSFQSRKTSWRRRMPVLLCVNKEWDLSREKRARCCARVRQTDRTSPWAWLHPCLACSSNPWESASFLSSEVQIRCCV